MNLRNTWMIVVPFQNSPHNANQLHNEVLFKSLVKKYHSLHSKIGELRQDITTKVDDISVMHYGTRRIRGGVAFFENEFQIGRFKKEFNEEAKGVTTFPYEGACLSPEM